MLNSYASPATTDVHPIQGSVSHAPQHLLLPEERMSVQQASYYTDLVNVRGTSEPELMAQGVAADRFLDATPVDLLDVENVLTGRHDVIGKCGYVIRHGQKVAIPEMPLRDGQDVSIEQSGAVNVTSVDEFLRKTYDRDVYAFSGRERSAWFREDVVFGSSNPPSYVMRQQWNDTRAQSKACLANALDNQ